MVFAVKKLEKIELIGQVATQDDRVVFTCEVSLPELGGVRCVVEKMIAQIFTRRLAQPICVIGKGLGRAVVQSRETPQNFDGPGRMGYGESRGLIGNIFEIFGKGLEKYLSVEAIVGFLLQGNRIEKFLHLIVEEGQAVFEAVQKSQTGTLNGEPTHAPVYVKSVCRSHLIKFSFEVLGRVAICLNVQLIFQVCRESVWMK